MCLLHIMRPNARASISNFHIRSVLPIRSPVKEVLEKSLKGIQLMQTSWDMQLMQTCS